MNWQTGAQRTPESKDCDEDENSERTPAPIAKQLLESRTILLTGPITDELSQKVMAQLLVLDAMDCEKPIRMYINSPGGSVDAGFAIYDSMRFVKSPVHSICTGLAASAATIILLGAAKGDRYSMPNTRFLLHQPSTGMQGQASDIAIGAQQILSLRKRINKLLADETGQTLEQIQTDTHRDHWMTAAESLEYGLIDTIVESAADVG
jgi:ATP-dependent Clp protease protease subunit